MLDVFTTALGPLLLGTTYFITTTLLPPDQPFFTGMMRALPTGLLLVLALRKFPPRTYWWKLCILSLLNFGLFFPLLFIAAYRLPGGLAATLGAVQPFIVALLGWFLLKQQPAAQVFVAAVVSVCGVGLLVIGPRAQLDTVGVLAALGAALSMALGTTLTKRWGRPMPLLIFTGWQLLIGGLFISPLVLLLEGLPATLSITNILGLIYLGVVNTALAYMLWFRGIQRLKASAVTFLLLLSPIVAVLLGYIFLNQSFTLTQGIGITLILMSVISQQGISRLNPRLHTNLSKT